MPVSGLVTLGVFWCFAGFYSPSSTDGFFFFLLNLVVGCRWYDVMTTYMSFIILLNFAGIKSMNSTTSNYFYVVTYVFDVNR